MAIRGSRLHIHVYVTIPRTEILYLREHTRDTGSVFEAAVQVSRIICNNISLLFRRKTLDRCNKKKKWL